MTYTSTESKPVGQIALWYGKEGSKVVFSGKFELKIDDEEYSFNVSLFEKNPEWNGSYIYSGSASYKQDGAYVNVARLYVYENNGQGDHRFYGYAESTNGKKYQFKLHVNPIANEDNTKPVLKGSIIPKQEGGKKAGRGSNPAPRETKAPPASLDW